MKIRHIVYWGMCAGIGLTALFLVLHQNTDKTVLIVPLLVWVIVFRLYEKLQAELFYRRNRSNSIREITITWPNVLMFTGLIILWCMNMQNIGFPVMVMSLGILLIAVECYSRTVRMYRFSDKGITDLNRDRLIPVEDIESIQMQEKLIVVKTATKTDALVIHVKKNAEQKKTLIKNLKQAKYGA